MFNETGDILPSTSSGLAISPFLDPRSPLETDLQGTGASPFSSSLPSALSPSPSATELEQQAVSVSSSVLSEQNLINSENNVFNKLSYNEVVIEETSYISPNTTQANVDSLLGSAGVNQEITLVSEAGTGGEILPTTTLSFTGSDSSNNGVTKTPKMPPGIIAESGFISNQRSIFDGDVYTNREVTNNGQTQFLDGHSLLIGDSVTTRNYGNLEPVEALRSIAAQVRSYESTKEKLIEHLLAVGNTLPLFDTQQHPLNSAQDVQKHLPSGTSDQLNIIKVQGNLTLPPGASLENVVLLFQSGGHFNANGAVTLKNVYIVDAGSANLGSLKAWDSSILTASGQIQMNSDARFGGRSLLATQNGNILFNGATFSTGEEDYLQVIANGGGITFNANAATRGQFRATGDFIQNGESELIGLVRVKGQARINGSLKFEAEWPKNLPVVAVLDTGISALSSDLDYGNIINGFDYVAQDADSFLNLGEGSEHGTFLTGLVAALSGNSVGIDGLNDEALIYNSRVTGSGKWAKALLEYVDWLKQTGQRNGIALVGSDLIQENADGSVTTRYDLTPEEREALRAAWDAGVLLIVPMGNEGGVASVLGQTSQEHKNVVSVVAIHNDTVTPYSNRGSGSVLSAEGGSLEAPVRSLVGSGVGTMLGTSVAAGYMTAYASILWAENPKLNYQQVIDMLTQTATDLGAAGRDEETGYGKVDLQAARELARKTEGKPIEASGILIPTSWIGEDKVDPLERPADSNEQADDTSAGATYAGSNPKGYSKSGTLNVPTPIPGLGDLFADERDYYKFSLSQDSKVSISLTNKQSSSNSNLSLKIQDPSGKFISSGGINDLAAGDYYVEVRLNTSQFGQEGKYTLNIDTISNSSPGNDDSSGNNDSSGDLPGDDDSGGLPGDNGQSGDKTGGGFEGFTVDLEFTDVYALHLTELGSITSASTSSNGIKTQLFSNGAIIGTSKGNYPVYGEMWEIYQARGGAPGSLGAPISNPQTSKGTTWQTFENGTLFEKDGKALQLDSKVLEKYFSVGGVDSFLGAPIEPATVDRNGFIRQPFENGYIVWNGKESVIYITGNSNSSVLEPTPAPIYNVTETIRFEIDNARLGTLGPGFGFGFDFDSQFSIKPEAVWNLPLGMNLALESSFNTGIYAFASTGRVDLGLSGDFQLSQVADPITGKASLSVNTAKLNPYAPYMSTYLGVGAGFNFSTGIKASLKNIPTYGDLSLEIGNEFKMTAEDLILQLVNPGLAKLGSFDLGFNLNTNFWNGNDLKADDTAGIKIDIDEVLKENKAGEISEFLNLGISLELKQESQAKLVGFRFDPDEDNNNNNDFLVNLGKSTTELLSFTPRNVRVRPEITLETSFFALAKGSAEVGVGNVIEGAFEKAFGKNSQSQFDDIPGKVLGGLPPKIGLSREMSIPLSFFNVSSNPFSTSNYWQTINFT